MNVAALWEDTGTTLEKVVIGIAVGFVIAALIMLFHKRVIGRFVRELIKRGATDPGNAMTLEELGLKARLAAASELKNPESALRKLVEIAPGEGGEPAGTRRLKTSELVNARFYVPEEKRIRAEVRYDAKNTTVPIVILCVIAFAAAAYLCIRYIPQLLEFRLFKN